MRKLRYNVAVSLDGFIAGTNGEIDWILMDSSIDFATIFNEFDTLLMGRKTFEVLQSQPPEDLMSGKQIVVVSHTLNKEDHPNITIINDRLIEQVSSLKEKNGKDIWLFGGGILFRNLLDAHLVDTVELAIMPILLSQGIPVLPSGQRSSLMQLEKSKMFSSGIVMLTYSVVYRAASPAE
jgi:dihydrofolate reductase